MVFIVRKVTADDLDVLFRIEAECFGEEAFSKDQLVYCLSATDFVALAASDYGEVVGFVVGSVDRLVEKGVGHVYTLDVKKDYRKRGIGGRLLEALESALVEKGINAFVLEVRVNNVAARRLYIKHGYKPVARLRDYYDVGVDAVRLVKTASATRTAFV